jgi:hypothetical protein
MINLLKSTSLRPKCYMKIVRIAFLLLLVLLCVPSIANAQSAAEKSWSPFWTQFVSAVKTRNKAAVKRLMASESAWYSGDGTRNEWLRSLDENGWWGRVQKSVSLGTLSYKDLSRRPSRLTKDKELTFQFIGGRWQFVGIMEGTD